MPQRSTVGALLVFVARTASRHACIAGHRVLRSYVLESDHKTHHCKDSDEFTCIYNPRVTATPIAREESGDCMTNRRVRAWALQPRRQLPLPASYIAQAIVLPFLRSHMRRQLVKSMQLDRRARMSTAFHAILHGVNAMFLLWGVQRCEHVFGTRAYN